MTRHFVRNTLVTVFLGFVCSGASCVSDGGSAPTGGYDHDTGGYDTDRYGDRADHPNRIPRRADLVREGTGKLRWRADLDGAIYVYDPGGDVVRYTGPVRRGDEVLVRPDNDEISVAGRVVSAENLRRDANHQLYFAVTGGPDRPDRADPYARRDPPPPARDVAANAVPSGATRLTRGSGTLDLAKAPAAGTVYVYDEDTKSVVYQTTLKRGTAFRVVPREGKVYANGEVLDRAKFVKGHTLGLYFAGR